MELLDMVEVILQKKNRKLQRYLSDMQMDLEEHSQMAGKF